MIGLDTASDPTLVVAIGRWHEPALAEVGERLSQVGWKERSAGRFGHRRGQDRFFDRDHAHAVVLPRSARLTPESE